MRVGAAVLVLATVGVFAGLEVPATRADDPGLTVTSVVTETRTVAATYQARGIRWWANRAVVNRREANARGRTVARLRRVQHRRWSPTVDYALRLASAVYGVPESKMRAVAYCESTLNPFATNGKYAGLFQLGWSPFGFSPFDPVASALSTAQTVVRDGGWRQWSCG